MENKMNIETVLEKPVRYLSIDTFGDIRIDSDNELVDRPSIGCEWSGCDLRLYLDYNEDTILCTQDNVDFLVALASFMQEHLDDQKTLTKPKKVVKKAKLKK
jgi:hypothetical protein